MESTTALWPHHTTKDERMSYVTNHEVRFSDFDTFGHINHLRLLEFFEREDVYGTVWELGAGE